MSEEEIPVEEIKLVKVKAKKETNRKIEITITNMTHTKIIGVTADGSGYSILRSKARKDVKIGDKLFIEK